MHGNESLLHQSLATHPIETTLRLRDSILHAPQTCV